MPKESTANTLGWWRPLETISLQINSLVVLMLAGISVKVVSCSRKMPAYFQVNNFSFFFINKAVC